MNKLLEELQSRSTSDLWLFNWHMNMQLNKLAMVTGLGEAMTADPLPDEVPTLDERNERDYQAAYAQVERTWRRDVGLHDYQPVFSQVCSVMNLIGIEHVNQPYNVGEKPIGMPSQVIKFYLKQYAPSSNAEEADDVWGAASTRETFVDMMRAQKVQDMSNYAERVVDLVNLTREKNIPLSEDATLEWLPKMVISACRAQAAKSKEHQKAGNISMAEAIIIRDEVLAIEAHAV